MNVGMTKRFSKSMEARNDLSTIPYLQMSRCLSAPDATFLNHCLKKQAAKTKMLSVVRIQDKEYLVLAVTSRLLLFTKYLTSTNMPTAQQKKGHKKKKNWSQTAVWVALLYVIIKSLRLCNKLTATFKSVLLTTIK